MQFLSAAELAARLNEPSRKPPLLLDVREPWEFELCRIEGSLLMPLASVPQRQQELDPEAEIVVICHHGVRSAHVCLFLEHQGFERLFNLSGGVAAWAEQVDPAMPRY